MNLSRNVLLTSRLLGLLLGLADEIVVVVADAPQSNAVPPTTRLSRVAPPTEGTVKTVDIPINGQTPNFPPPNQAPVINITAPASGANLAVQSSINFSANASDPDGVITSVQLLVNGSVVARPSAPPYQIRLHLETPGQIVLVAEATDDKGAPTRATNVINAAIPSPPSLSVTNGLRLWLKADAGVTKDATGAVSVWKDQSGHTNDAVQPNPVSAPKFVNSAVYNQPVLRFDGVENHLEVASAASLNLTADISTFCVAKVDDTANERVIWSQTISNLAAPNIYYLSRFSGVPRVSRGNGTPGGIGSADGDSFVRSGSYSIFGFQMAGTTLTHYMNLELYYLNKDQAAGGGKITTPLMNGGRPLKIGSRDDGFTRMKGDVAELLIFDRSISADERHSVAAYLAAKYGMSGVLASNSLPVVQFATPSDVALVNAPTNLTVSATALDSDGSIVRVDFFANRRLVGSASEAPFQTQFFVPVASQFVLTATATDNLGGTATALGPTVTANSTAPSPLPVTQNLQVWLKADGGITTNAAGVVLSWVDHSGRFNNPNNASSATGPTLVSNGLNDLPTLRFTGRDSLSVSTSPGPSLAGDITTLFVVKYDDFAQEQTVWAQTGGFLSHGPNLYLLEAMSGLPKLIRSRNGVSASAREAPVAGSFHIGGFEVTGTHVAHYLNGRDIGGGEIRTADGSSVNLTIGARFDRPFESGVPGPPPTRLRGEIAEILIYDTALTERDRNKVVDYLSAKYFNPILRVTGTSLLPNGFVLEWSANASLEEANQITGPWTTVPNATSPFTSSVASHRKFYRLRP